MKNRCLVVAAFCKSGARADTKVYESERRTGVSTHHHGMFRRRAIAISAFRLAPSGRNAKCAFNANRKQKGCSSSSSRTITDLFRMSWSRVPTYCDHKEKKEIVSATREARPVPPWLKHALKPLLTFYWY